MTDIHAKRRSRAWEALVAQAPEADALLITSLPNVCYLTGFTGSNGMLLLTPSTALLGTDGRYVVQAGQECPGLALLIDRSTLSAVATRWVDGGGAVLALEADHVTVTQWRHLVEIAGDDESRLRATSDIVEVLRQVKDGQELAALERACQISDEALGLTIAEVRVGDTEREIARRLENHMLSLGADGLSFETIVAGGPHSAIPHHQPTDRPLAAGDFLLIDFGAQVGGYHADETRTFVMGAPSDWQVELHDVVHRAQVAGRAAARAGKPLVDVDAAARQLIEQDGYGAYFDHGLGHGVGLQIHEAPFFSPRATGMLLAGSPVTIEPGVYLPGRGGVRIEDTVIVTEGECSPLTTADRGLVLLD